MQHTFTVVIERDAESGWLIGDVVELPGCHTEAPDLQSLEVSVTEAINVYLETVDFSDEEPLNEFVGTMRIHVPAPVHLSA